MAQTPSELKPLDRRIGEYPLISELALCVMNAMANFRPDRKVLNHAGDFLAKIYMHSMWNMEPAQVYTT
jgi:hypothetical protein